MRTVGLVLSLLLTSSDFAAAQSAPSAANADDKRVAKGVSGAVADWEEEPWWIALADCAAAFRLAPSDPNKTKAFSLAAIDRVSSDRRIDLKSAAAIVMPYAISGEGLERAKTTSEIFGSPDDLRSRCDGVMVQYRAAFP